MNLLINNAPNYITVGGKKLYIKTDFSLWVSFIISCENNDLDGVFSAVNNIFGEIPKENSEFIQACMDWLFPKKEKNSRNGEGGARTSQAPFDFEIDGNIIYCELWEYFPHLMERGISFHEGMELLKLLLHNENTMLWHRAFARCADFSKLDKEQKKYWQQQRAIYAIKPKNTDNTYSDVMCGDFW